MPWHESRAGGARQWRTVGSGGTAEAGPRPRRPTSGHHGRGQPHRHRGETLRELAGYQKRMRNVEAEGRPVRRRRPVLCPVSAAALRKPLACPAVRPHLRFSEHLAGADGDRDFAVAASRRDRLHSGRDWERLQLSLAPGFLLATARICSTWAAGGDGRECGQGTRHEPSTFCAAPAAPRALRSIEGGGWRKAAMATDASQGMCQSARRYPCQSDQAAHPGADSITG
ncbi:hypothetical protein ACCO45_001230 [Purpureocillium lilacinum]|uniref:Uncharacterized protein n=1 Tax=Purpureocillium lilacinum TaxID=33203 RepID=A0ACC4E9A3_PURLI